MEKSDSQLIKAFQSEGDLGAAEELLLRYKDKLYSFLFQMLGAQHDAQDALQETMLSVLKNLNGYNEQNQFKAWIFRIARNKAINVMRFRKKTVLSDEPEMLENQMNTDSGEETSSRISKEEKISELNKALQKLPDNEREVVVLRIQGEIPFKEIAEMTGVSINTVLGRMHNAKKRLKQLLETMPS